MTLRPQVFTSSSTNNKMSQGCLRSGMLQHVAFLILALLPIMRMHCHQVRSHSGSSGCWGFLCITVGFLPYNLKGVEMTDLALYKQNLLN